MKIWKFILPSCTDLINVTVPEDPVWLNVQMEPSYSMVMAPVVWALIDETRPPKLFSLMVVSTGVELDRRLGLDGWKYLGTVLDETIALHVFVSPGGEIKVGGSQ